MMIDYDKKMTGEYIESVGRRKTATARVRMFKAKKTEVIVNGQPVEEYFPTEEMQLMTKEPFTTVEELADPFFVSVHVSGSGLSGQAQAVRHGISRALVDFSSEAKKPLKDKGFLKRDPRMVERKKPGRKKARKSSQWSKR
ncbi:MAG: 30S ribosomal protein S9 [Candidatus Paceibacterota bacterium]